MARPPHIIALREDLKAAIAEFRAFGIERSRDPRIVRLYAKMPMRQLWTLTHIYMRSVYMGYREAWQDHTNHEIEAKVFKAGAKLYGARNPKLAEQLMMESLTRK